VVGKQNASFRQVVVNDSLLFYKKVFFSSKAVLSFEGSAFGEITYPIKIAVHPRNLIEAPLKSGFEKFFGHIHNSLLVLPPKMGLWRIVQVRSFRDVLPPL